MMIYAARNMVNMSDKVRLHNSQPVPMDTLPNDYWSSYGTLIDECSVQVFQILTGRTIEPGEVIEMESAND